ncbi:asialoglycoprotein receptor 2-like isoform X2 [Hypomesus transpacificus]|uniref:asialoglycoprotein receptor 2-like isoform X2 n=1 Tax=Hypomesus transpacificus TaxID=137520 RepID=UPI001F087B4B|nr:asialoglycoprotein receptor 2-like isoform X2 [Hypomesus transpacificus]
MEMGEYVNVPEAKKKILDTRPLPGSWVITVVAVSFGLLCVLQVSLNISLRLIYWRNWTDESQINQTEEIDQLQISYDKLSNEKGMLQISHNSLENEKKTLQTEIMKLNSRIRSCTLCDHGWTRLDSSCYYISTEQKTWEESRQDCTQRGARLVIINSEQEQTILTELKLRVWIGLSDISKEIWQWVDGSSVSNVYWTVGEPNNFEGNPEGCVEIRPLRDDNNIMNWNDERCHFRRNWCVNVPEGNKKNTDTGPSPGSKLFTVVAVSFGLLCVLQVSLNISLRLISGSLCDHGWTRLDSSCYYISTEQKTWEESRQDCTQRGARLVIINSEKEQELLTLLNIRVWIGLWDKDSNRVWKWVDGTSLGNGRYWKVGEPNNYRGASEDCVEIRPENDGLINWNDDTCSFQKNWVCEH